MPAGSGYAAAAPVAAAAAPDLLAAALDDPSSAFPPNGTCNLEVSWEMRRILAAASRERDPDEVPAPPALVERPCATATQTLRGRAALAMRRELERQRAVYILDHCGPSGRRQPVRQSIGIVINESSGGPRAVSSTNVQVAGVDEPDFVKSDGHHLYAAANGKVQIFETWPPERAHLAAKLFDLGNPKKLLLDGDRLVVLSSVPRPASLLRRASPECTYGYDCDFGGDGSATRVTVFDVQDRTAPKAVRTLDISGSLLTARRVGSNVHVVVHDSGPSWEQLGIERRPREPLETPRKAFDAFERLIKENEALLARIAPEELLPKVSERNPGEQSAPGPEAPCRIHAATDGAKDLVSLVSFDTRGPRGFARTLVGSQAGAVYSSPDALYLAVREHTAAAGEWPDRTTIHQFDLDGPRTRYAASGRVKGRVLNQFAMDEHKGHLRVAATTGHPPQPNAHTTLTVLRRQGGALSEVGKVDHLALGEDIRSVRFQEDRGFVVTFKKTDPLFVFDLSVPEAPRVQAELKVPGFSTYMHFLDPTHLLTVGFDADDQGDFAWFTGILLQVFDVSRPTDPTLLHRTVIGTRGSSSQAATDHLAFNYFEPKRLLALPITVCEGAWKGGARHSAPLESTFSGLMLYDASVTGGLKLRHKVSHDDGRPVPARERTAARREACSGWWSQSESHVKRSIFADDYVFSVSNEDVRIADLRNRWRRLPVLPLR